MRLRHANQSTTPRPNLKRLARAGDVEGLRRALEYREIVVDEAGMRFDLGVPLRIEALEVLASNPSPAAQAAIVAALADESVDVRLVAMRATQDYQDEHVLNALTWAIGSAPVRTNRLDPRLYESLAAKAEAWRHQALETLKQLDEPRALEQTASYMIHRGGTEPLEDADLEALRTLAITPRTQATVAQLAARLTGWLGHERPEAATRTGQVLTAFGPPAIDALIAALDEPDRRVRAIRVLGRLRDKSVTSTIAVYADDPDASVRLAVMEALKEIRDPASVRALFAGANDDSYVVRSAACAALDDLGSAAVIVAVTSILGPALERIAGAAPELASPEALALAAPAEPGGQPSAAADAAAGVNGADAPDQRTPNGHEAGRRFDRTDTPRSGVRQLIGALVGGRQSGPSGPDKPRT